MDGDDDEDDDDVIKFDNRVKLGNEFVVSIFKNFKYER